MTERVGLAWELTSTTGWGVYGTNLTLELIRRGSPSPLLLKRPAQLSLDPIRRRMLQPLIQQQQHVLSQLKNGGSLRAASLPFPVIKTLTSSFEPMTAGKWFFGVQDLGIIFFENTNIDGAAVERAKHYGAIVCGSTWNTEVLRNEGVQSVHCIIQGVDPSLFHPAVKHKQMRDRFLIFSGGKAEHRKGQDLVLAAFRRFHQRHPEALLITAWQSPWPAKARDLSQSPHVTSPPEVLNGQLDIVGWARANGLPEDSVIDIGLVPNQQMPRVLGQCDCAVFASRYESGTNLPAMEAMACGLPVILSDNTGHKDIINDDRCFPLRHQASVAHVPDNWGSTGWGESDVDEIVHRLEQIHADIDTAQRLGNRAAEWIHSELSWERQITRLVSIVDTLR